MGSRNLEGVAGSAVSPRIQISNLRAADGITFEGPVSLDAIFPEAILTGGAFLKTDVSWYLRFVATFYPDAIVIDLPVESVESGLAEDRVLYLTESSKVEEIRRVFWEALIGQAVFKEVLGHWLSRRNPGSDLRGCLCAESHWNEAGENNPPRLELTESDLRAVLEKGVC